jgi:peptide/nickel transport system substrate-binding protein
MPPMLRRCVRALAAFAIVTLPFAAAGATRATAQSGLEFHVGLIGAKPTFDIATDASALAEEVWTLQYPRLTEYDASDLTPVPGIADAWTPSRDGRSYTYHLRDGLTWSDGSPLTPDDVVASIDRARDEGWPGTSGALDDLTARVSGAHDVVVESSRLDTRLPVIPVHIVPQKANALTVGSGPFVIAEKRDGFVRMVANNRWWAGRPRLDAVEFRTFANGDALASALERGDIDAASYVPSSEFDRINGNGKIATVYGNDGEYYSLVLDTGNALLDDPRVRRALWFSIDSARLIDEVEGGVSRSAPLPTVARGGVWGFDSEVAQRLTQRLEIDLDAARAQLRAADVGLVDLPIAVSPADPTAVRTARAIVELLQGSSFDARIVTDASAASARVVHRDPGDDPSEILRQFTCGTDDSWWCDERYDRLFDLQANDLDPASRIDTVRRMQSILVAQAPEVPLFHDDLLEAFRSDRWKNTVRQPEASGPAFFTASAPTFVNVEVAPKFGSDKVSSAVILLAVLVIVVVAGGVTALYLVVRSRTARRPSPPEPAPSTG